MDKFTIATWVILVISWIITIGLFVYWAVESDKIKSAKFNTNNNITNKQKNEEKRNTKIAWASFGMFVVSVIGTAIKLQLI